MNDRLTRFGVGLVIASLSGAAVPQPRPSATILANEADNCEAWVLDPTPARKYWVFGYLSGLNACWGGSYRSPTDWLARIGGEEPVILWMDNYCRNHPLDSLQKGAHQLYLELGSR